MSRHSSKPEAPGSITSSSTQSGCRLAALPAVSWRRLRPGPGSRPPRGSRASARRSRLVLDDEHQGRGGIRDGAHRTVSPTDITPLAIFAVSSQSVRTSSNSLANPPGVHKDPISRRSLLRGGVSLGALAAVSACDSAVSPISAALSSTSARVSSRVGANVRVTHDGYREHVGPSVAANPRHPRQLLVACQASPVIPERIVTYLSFDAGASWRSGGVPPQPEAGPAGDDVTVAFDAHGRGYVCATRSGHGPNVNPANLDATRAIYVWRTDDGGRSFSPPVTLVEGQYCDHPWIATGQGRTSGEQDVYVAWGAGASHTALDLTHSADGGRELRGAAQDPGGGPDPLAGQRRPPTRGWIERPGVRGL